MDQLYNGSGDDDTVQLSTTCSLTFTITVWFCLSSNSGGPALTIINSCIIIIATVIVSFVVANTEGVTATCTI